MLLTSLDLGLVGVQRGTYTTVSSDRLQAQRFLGVNADTLPSGDALVISGTTKWRQLIEEAVHFKAFPGEAPKPIASIQSSM